MNTLYLLKGIAIGFSLALPVGPIGVLCIRRTLLHGGRQGITTGLAAGTADMMYGMVAAFGISLVSDFITAQQFWIRLIGGIFLLGLGIRTLRHHPDESAPKPGSTSQTGIFISTFFLTLTNPMTMFAFAAVFAGIGIERITQEWGAAPMLVLGVFLGSLAWFLFLTGMVRLFKESISTKGILLINRLSAALILFFGSFSLLSLLPGFPIH